MYLLYSGISLTAGQTEKEIAGKFSALIGFANPIIFFVLSFLTKLVEIDKARK